MFYSIFFNQLKNGIVLSEKIRNSGNYNYAHSFFGKDFQSKPLYWFWNRKWNWFYIVGTQTENTPVQVGDVAFD